MAILKTAFPLLALSMEMIVDQVSTRFKPSPDEDIYRLISALLADSLQQYVGRAAIVGDDGLLSTITVSNIARFAENLHPVAIKVSLVPSTNRGPFTDDSSQAQFEKDFLTSQPTLREYLQRLREWRDRYETLLNKKAKRANLESVSHWLVEFQYQKFDEIEVPGQYLKVSRAFSISACRHSCDSVARGQQRQLRSHQSLCQQVRRYEVSRRLLPSPNDPGTRRKRAPLCHPSSVCPHVPT